MKIHESLEVWKRAIEFAERIYLVTANFPPNEQYGLTSQFRRAAVSIPSNVAEGAARQSKKEFVQFLYMAAGSASEINTQLELALRFGYISSELRLEVGSQLEAISKMIFGLIKSLRVRMG